MLKKVFSGLNQRKVKVFLVCLACSFLAWLVSKLSEPYESRVTFTLNYINLPDTLLLSKEANTTLGAKLRTNGFRFLYYNFNLKNIKVDLSGIREAKGRYYLDALQLKKSLESQLANSTSLIELEKDTLYVDLYQVAAKEVPVKPTITLNMSQNHFIEGPLRVEPAAIVIKGPEREVGSITEVVTAPIELNNLSTDFNRQLEVVVPEGLQNSELSHSSVTVSGKVVKFSEKVFEVPITVLNPPEEYDLKLFPNKVSVLCKAGIKYLRTLTANDFRVVADYANAGPSNHLMLRIDKRPEKAYDVKLQENQVQFILEKSE